MKRSIDRILTTHVGSLPRPEALLKNFAKARSRQGDETLEANLTHDVAEIVRKQVNEGVDIVNDGEFGKSGWASYALDRISGFEERPDKLYEAQWLSRSSSSIRTPGLDCKKPARSSGKR